jgi:hypothetical protein
LFNFGLEMPPQPLLEDIRAFSMKAKGGNLKEKDWRRGREATRTGVRLQLYTRYHKPHKLLWGNHDISGDI